MRGISFASAVLAVCVVSCDGFVSPFLSRHTLGASLKAQPKHQRAEDFCPVSLPLLKETASGPSNHAAHFAAFTGAFAAGTTPLPAHASGFEVIPSALAAYAHYGCILGFMACVVAERTLVKPGMSRDDEELLAKVDIVYGIVGIALAVSGYLRVTQYGKGWEFYQHEPIFWVKLALAGVLGALSFFPTIKITQRSLAMNDGKEVPPLSEKLARRLQSIMNAELLAILAIPLAATTMSRGLFYIEGFPWLAGAIPTVLVFAASTYKYVSEALKWQEDDPSMEIPK